MRVGFMGTPQFAADILEDIHERIDIACVFTRPDAVRGRGNKLIASPVKEVAQRLGIDVHAPSTLKSSEVIDILESYSLDVIIVAAYGMILPKAVLEIPQYGCLNVHASLLPRWRGAAPIERAILAGDESVGVCIMRMEEGLDTGAYCVSRSIPVGDMDSQELTAELASLGAVSLITALNHLEAGAARWIEQDPDGVTYADKIEKSELDINPELSVIENLRRVRASSDAHPSKCRIAGRDVVILKCKMPEDEEGEGQSVASGKVSYIGKRLMLGCEDGALEVLELKPVGKRAMDAISFVSGVQEIRKGDACWESIDEKN